MSRIDGYVLHPQCLELVEKLLIGVGNQVRTENRDNYNYYGNDCFGRKFVVRIKPHKRKGQWPKAQQGNHHARRAKVPFFRPRSRTGTAGAVKKLATVPALDGLFLNLLGAKGAFLHASRLFYRMLFLLLHRLFYAIIRFYSHININRLFSKVSLGTFWSFMTCKQRGGVVNIAEQIKLESKLDAQS